MKKIKAKSLLSEFMAMRRAELNDMSQKQLAHISGVNLGTIASIESGQSKIPRRETLDKVAKGLQVDPTHLWLLATSDELPNAKNANQLAGKALTELHLALVKVHKIPMNVAHTVRMLAEQLIQTYDPKLENHKLLGFPTYGIDGDMARILEFQEFSRQGLDDWEPEPEFPDNLPEPPDPARFSENDL